MLLLLLLFILLIACGVRRETPGEREDFLSPSGSASVRGAVAAAVVLHHLSKEVAIPSVLLPFMPIGYLAVTLFYFYSGYGLCRQMEQRPDYLKRFYRSRLPKLLIPFWGINLLYAAWEWGAGIQHTPLEWIISILGIRLFNEDAWYVLSLVILYVAFHICYSRLERKRAEIAMGVVTAVYIVVCMATDQGMWRFVSVGGFWLGLLYAHYSDKIQKLLNRGRTAIWCAKGWAACFVCGIAFQALAYFRLVYPVLEQECSILASGLLLCVFWRWMPQIRFGNRALSLLGKISYELYLIHRLFFQIFHHPAIAVENDALFSVLCSGCAVLTALGLHWLFQKSLSLLEGKKRKTAPDRTIGENEGKILGILS